MATQQNRLRLVHRAQAALTVVVIVTLLIGRAAGAITSSTAILLFFAIELPLLAAFAVVTIIRFARSPRRDTAAPRSLLERIEADEPLLRPAVVEVRLFASLLRLLTRRHRVPSGATPFGYTRRTMTTPLVFIVLSLVELVIVHLLVPWGWLRAVLLVLTVWGMLFLLGYLASRIVHPHFVTRDQVHLRWGLTRVLVAERAQIVSVDQHVDHASTQPCIDDERLVLAAFQGTNVSMRFAEPLPVDAPVGRKQRGAGIRVQEVWLYVDDPDAFVSILRTNTLTGARTEGEQDAG